jgi:hypothetical protein
MFETEIRESKTTGRERMTGYNRATERVEVNIGKERERESAQRKVYRRRGERISALSTGLNL